jgi:putative flippase GtrA
VRHPQSVARAPAFLVAAYAMLLWSSIRVFGDRRTEDFRNYSGRFCGLRQEGAAIEGAPEIFEDGEVVFAQG